MAVRFARLPSVGRSILKLARACSLIAILAATAVGGTAEVAAVNECDHISPTYGSGNFMPHNYAGCYEVLETCWVLCDTHYAYLGACWPSYPEGLYGGCCYCW